MNPPMKKMMAIIVIMFLSLMAALTYIHFFQAAKLNADGRNARTIYRQYQMDRGSIVVAGEPIADSVPSDDDYKYLRTYAQGSLYAHLTGYYSVVYNSMAELEKSQNSVLSGSDSSLFKQRIQELITGKQPQGGTVALTIDPAVQQAAAQALGNRKGAVVAINPTSGKILAMYSSPSYDPNQLASHSSETAQQAWESYNSNPDKPLLNRASGGDLYPPGSVFKIITASAMLESGLTPESKIDSPTLYTLPGTTTQIPNATGVCGDGSGKSTLRTALVLSCNTSFAKAGVDLGASVLQKKAEDFGFGKSIDIGISMNPSQFPDPADEASLAMDAFGQKDIQVSPLQMAMVASAVANHGTLMQPYLVDQTLSSDLEILSTTKPRVFSEPISRGVADQLTSMMLDVTKHDSLGLPGVNVASKTGTAENAGEDHAWFISFEAAEDSRVAVAVFVEHGGYGARTAGPIAMSVMKAALHQ